MSHNIGVACTGLPRSGKLTEGGFPAQPLHRQNHSAERRVREDSPLELCNWRVYYRLLEAGTFETIPSNGPCTQLDSTQLAMLLGGVSLAAAKQRKRYRRAS